MIKLTKQLDKGATGADVKTLQSFLVKHKHMTQAQMDTGPGTFGSQTQAAVQAYQKAAGIVSSGTPTSTGYGRIGPSTMQAINIALATPKYTFTPTVDKTPIYTPKDTVQTTTPTYITPSNVQTRAEVDKAEKAAIVAGQLAEEKRKQAAIAEEKRKKEKQQQGYLTQAATLKAGGAGTKGFQDFFSFIPEEFTSAVSAFLGYTPIVKAEVPTATLKPGDEGKDVEQLQRWLIKEGVFTQKQMETGLGIYGPQTKAAVAHYQDLHNIDTKGNPGYFGPLTKSHIAQATGKAVTKAVLPEGPQFTPAAGVGTKSKGYIYTTTGWVKESQITPDKAAETVIAKTPTISQADVDAANAAGAAAAKITGITFTPGTIETYTTGKKEEIEEETKEIIDITKETTVETTGNVGVGSGSVLSPDLLSRLDAIDTNLATLNEQATKDREAFAIANTARLAENERKQTAAQLKIDAITEQQKDVLGDVDELTKPFREELEKTERERLQIERNFFENQTLTDELDSLLTEGNALIRQQKEATGLAAIRDPRVNQTISDVNSRAGVIQAVLASRNNQIIVATTLIDRTVNAINADRNDRLMYYQNLYNFYEKARDVEDRKLIILTSDEKGYIQENIDLLKTDIALSLQTAENIKAAMINPATALMYATAGITLNDSVEAINLKLAQYTYQKEVTTKSNVFMADGYEYLQPSEALVLDPTTYVTQIDSQGVVSYWKKPIDAVSAEKPIIQKINGITHQLDPTTGEWHEITSPALRAQTTKLLTATIGTIDTQLVIIKRILNNVTGLDSAVGARWTTRFAKKLTLEKKEMFRQITADIDTLAAKDMIKSLEDLKGRGVTLESSEAVLKLLQDASSNLGTWQRRDKEGNTTHYEIGEVQMVNELIRMEDTLEMSKKDAQLGMPAAETDSTQATTENPFTRDSFGL